MSLLTTSNFIKRGKQKRETEEYATEEGRQRVAKRIHQLFSEVRDENPMVFDKYEKIGVGSSQIVEVINELQDYRLVADEKNQSQWDLMGAAYEEYAYAYLKKKGGQYFTNRLIVDLLVRPPGKPSE